VVTEIVARRSQLTSEAKATPAWLLTSQIVDEAMLESLLPYVTARGLQFTIESLGYADHVGTFARLEAVIEMRGSMAQIVYYRDLTTLGRGYPVCSEFEAEEGAGHGDRKSG
jgi:hypothetical protein